MDSDEREFSVAVTGATPDTDLSAEDGEEDWRDDWEPIRMQLKEGAKRRVVVTTIDKRGSEREKESEGKYDSKYCDFGYAAALEAVEELEQEKRRSNGGLQASKTAFGGRLRKQLRQVALDDSDDDDFEEEEKNAKKKKDKKKAQNVAWGDVWWNKL